MLFFKNLNTSNYHTIFDNLIPRNILNQDYERDYLARRNLLQARAIITVIVSAMIALIIQLVIDLYLSYQHVGLLHIAWPFSFIGTLICAVILYFIPSERISISQAAKIGIYFFLSISAYASFFGTQIQTLSHANFFIVPPFSYIFVSKEFGKQTTIVVCIMHVTSFFRSLGKQTNPISLSSSGWVVCDVYILCFIYFLFVAYEQEFQSNQERTQKSLVEARSAATAKSMFISNVSHELRTPLHGILATVEILAKTQLNKSQRTLLSAIESCGTNLISVVNQVLTYARIEHNKLELEHNIFDIYTIMQEIGDGLAPIPESKNLDFFVCVEVNPLQRFLVGDVGVLRQIILNLLGNAIKFTDKGRIELVTIEITSESKKDEQEQLKRQVITSKELETIKDPSSASVQINYPGQLFENQKDNTQKCPKALFRINVNDTGRGIAPDFISHMYQPFSQEDSSLKRQFEGTGLGLSIVKGLLDLMHSQLEVDSKLGQGSKFSFKLELPVSDRLDNMNASPLPFDHKYLKLPPTEQEMLIKRLRSLSYVVLNVENFLLSQKIAHNLDQWGFSYRLLSKDKLKFECKEQHADVVILNDNINDLELFLNEFINYYRKPKNMRIEEESIDGVMKERQQHVLFFSTIENYQQVETFLTKYRPQSVEIVTKPAGPVKILTAIIKTIESSMNKYDDGIMKGQEEKIRSIREEYLDFVKSSNNNHKFGTMDIGQSGELTISPSRLTPPAMIERIISEVSGEDKETILDQEQLKEESNMQLGTKGAKNKETEKKPQKYPKNISFLIVEDNKINEMILTTMLKQSGYYNYDIANNGLEAVENFTKKSYDIIFMDLQMPICDGIVATKEIRKIERGEESYLLQSHTSSPESQSPSGTSAVGACRIGRRRRKKAIIVAMTGLASDEDSQAAEAAGCNEFLTKPVSIKSLNARMKSWTKEALKEKEEEITSSEEESDEQDSEKLLKLL